MYNLLLVEEVQSVENLYSKSPDEFQGESLVVVTFDQFVEVHTQKFECDTLLYIYTIITTWFLNITKSDILTTLVRFSSSFSLMKVRMLSSTKAWFWNFFLFFMIFMAQWDYFL